MQAQFNKANDQVTECKDHIITNANMVKSGVMTVEIKVANSNFLLPTSDHPFDHFMIVTLINRRLKNERTDEKEEQSIKNGESKNEQKN